MKNITRIILLLLGTCLSLNAKAVSFSADAVQLRGSDISHARIFWDEGKVRFEYVDQGVPMVQIFDNKKNKIIWLDTESKVYVERDLSENQVQPVGKKANTKAKPCDNYPGAECTRLKQTRINGRKVNKWLITLDVDGKDQHIFQWLDSQYGIPLRQENPDGSVLDARILDDQEFNGRKVWKLDMSVISPDGSNVQGIQWYDSKLGIVVRQQAADGAVDELRNIKVEKIKPALFAIPKDYKSVDAQLSELAPKSSASAAAEN